MTPMSRCQVCGAGLHDDVAWCLRCYSPRLVPPPGTPVRADDPRGRPPAEPFEVEYSNSRPGPLSHGWIGRGVTSLVLVVLLWWIYIYAFPFMGGSPTGPFFLLFLAVAGPVLVIGLRRIWRPTRIR